MVCGLIVILEMVDKREYISSCRTYIWPLIQDVSEACLAR